MWHNPLKLHMRAYCFSLTVENWNNIMQFIETMVSYIFLLSIKTGTFCKHDTGCFELLIAHMTVQLCNVYELYNVCSNMILYRIWSDYSIYGRKNSKRWKSSRMKWTMWIKYAKLHKLWYLWTTLQHTVPFEDSFMLKRSEIQRKMQKLSEYNQIRVQWESFDIDDSGG